MFSSLSDFRHRHSRLRRPGGVTHNGKILQVSRADTGTERIQTRLAVSAPYSDSLTGRVPA